MNDFYGTVISITGSLGSLGRACVEAFNARGASLALLDRGEGRLAEALRDFRGASTREAANVLGIAENAVKVRLFRARRALRESLQQTLERGDLLSTPADAGTRTDKADASVALAG